jgi:hypothetical protein
MNMKSENTMIDKLIEEMDLERPNLIISSYEYKDSMIVIKQIDVVDNENNFLRKADLSKVFPYLSISNIKFNGVRI